LSEDHEYRLPRCKFQGYGGAPLGGVVRPWLGCAGIWMPQFNRLPGDAESRTQGFIAVVAIIEEIEIALSHLAVDKQHIGVRLRAGVGEIGSYVQSGERLAKSLFPVYVAFSERCTIARSPKLVGNLLELLSLVCTP